MILQPIITDLFDLDLQKLMVQYSFLKTFPYETQGVYKFINRGKDKFSLECINEIKEQVANLKNITFKNYLVEKFGNKVSVLNDPMYLAFLKSFRLNPERDIIIEAKNKIVNGRGQEKFDLDITIQGKMSEISLYETYIMCIVSECFFAIDDTEWSKDTSWMKTLQERTLEKAYAFNSIGKLLEFGTRRRRSRYIQEEYITKILKAKCENFVGTSNVLNALNHDIKCYGTLSHEWYMANAALVSLNHANYFAIENMIKVFNGKVDVCLPDTFTADTFLNDISDMHISFLSAYRQDSGNPYVFTNKIVELLKSKRINPKYKSIIYSDSLNTAKASEINEKVKDDINPIFAIGTYLTNDFPGSPSLNMVIKPISYNGIPVVKLSDDPGKESGDVKMLEIVKYLNNFSKKI